MRALAERHPELGDHHDGVAELVGEVASRLGVEGEELTQLRHAASLHDIGKVAIPDAIITKPEPLTEDEWAFMRRHTLIGERILAAAPALSAAARLVRSTHEAWDGSGYPDGSPVRDPARRPDHRRVRRVRRDDLEPALRAAQDVRRGAR